MSNFIKSNFAFGILPKAVMRDKDVTIQGKAIYAYLCVYAGNKSEAFPSVSLITHELGISKDTFYKHLKILKKVGYITTKQERSEKGVFSKTVYILQPFPKKPCTDLPDTVLPDTDNKETKNNSFNNNNIKNNSFDDDKKIIKNKFNDIVINKIKNLTERRNEKLDIILKEYDQEDLLKAIDNISKSDYLITNIKFDWFIKPDNFIKVLEGNYNNTDTKTQKNNKKSSNFKQRTDKYTQDDWDKFNKKLREKYKR